MTLFGLEIRRRQKQAPASLQSVSDRGGWWSIIREAFPGAWQRNVEWHREDVLAFGAVYACVSLIAGDISKLRIKLVTQDADGIWQETENPAYSPVLRKPNHYQTRIAFIEQWVTSKLIHGNTYVLKQRDNRRVVTALYVLDPTRVRPMVAPDGSVYYAIGVDNLSKLEQEIIAPASEIIHDKAVTLYHPLVGVSPITACGLAAMQGLKIQQNSANLFSRGSMPGGIVYAPPAEIQNEEDQKQLQANWEASFGGDNYGRVAVLGNDWKFESVGIKATDAQLIEQLKWTAEHVCMAFHVPPYKIGAAAPPPHNNIEALNQEYYAQALQNPIESIELLLDEGLSTPSRTGTEFDLDDLLRMDSMTRVQTAEKAVKGGMSVNEVRARYHDLGPVKGGDVPFLQQQDWPIDVLAQRDLAALTGGPTPSRAEAAADLSDAEAEKQVADLWEEECLGVTTNDLAVIVRGVAPVVRGYITAMTVEYEQRLATLESRLMAAEQRAMTPGPAGKDAEPVDLDALALKAAELVPTPKDGRHGKDAEPVDLDALVLRVAALVPKGQAGPEGPRGERGPAGESGPPGERGEAGPMGPAGPIGEKGLDGRDGKDGVGYVQSLMNRSGELVLVKTDGTSEIVGHVVGKDGRDGVDGKDGQHGRDGISLGLEHLSQTAEFDPETRTATLRFSDGTTTKDVTVKLAGVVVYRGIFDPARAYEPGDQVTYAGSQWIAREATQGIQPDEHATMGKRAWTLSAKRGRDGKVGPAGPSGPVGPKGEKGERGPERW